MAYYPNKCFVYYQDTLLGRIGLVEESGFLIRVLYADLEQKEGVFVQETPLIRNGFCQIKEYLSGKRPFFDLPILTKGTPFQKRVWQALQDIPYGTTVSYQDLADKIGNPKAARAVGMANHHNPCPILIPCHRVIGKNGRLVGYAGGIELKQKLLDLERQNR